MTRPRILLDCDPGIDDVFAIFCALRYADLAAITTVSGNVSVELTTRNAAHAVRLARRSTPVHCGAARPLSVDPVAADRVHGHSGLGDIDVPEPVHPISDVPAIDAIDRHCRPSGVLVATGPLTNIATLIATRPQIVERIEHLYWMGGSTTGGNTTVDAEFNAWADPHAVDLVFGSGVPVTMFGLNLTRQVRLSTPHIEHLREAATTTSVAAADLLRYYERATASHDVGQPIHDPCAVLGVTHPDLFEYERSFSVVDTEGPTRGKTRMSTMNHPRTSPITVATRADAGRVVDVILAACIEPGTS